MPKHKHFDWYTFLAKKVLRCDIFGKKKFFMSFWIDEDLSQGSPFVIHALFANSWDCSATIDLRLKVKSKTFISTKKQANKLIVPRNWHIPLQAGEIILASIPGYASFDCKPSSISFSKAKVSKEGKGKCIFKREGKSLGESVNPLGFLFLPFGFILISTSSGASLKLSIQKDKTKTKDKPDNLRPKNLMLQSIWTPDQPFKLDLTYLIAACAQLDGRHFNTDIERLCREAHSKWSRKHKDNADIVIITSEDTPSVAEEDEGKNVIETVPVNYNLNE